MAEIKNAYEVCATRQTNFGDEDYSVKVFDSLSEAKNKFFEYVEDFIIGAVASRNYELEVETGKAWFILSPKYGFEIETGNMIVLLDVRSKEPKAFVCVDDGFKLSSSTEIENKVSKIEEKYKNATYDAKKDKIIY